MGLTDGEKTPPKKLSVHCSHNGNMRGMCREQGQSKSSRTMNYFEHLRIHFKRGKKIKNRVKILKQHLRLFLAAALCCITFLIDFFFFALKIYIIFQSFFSEVNLK